MLWPLANCSCCEIMAGASTGLSGGPSACPLCPVPRRAPRTAVPAALCLARISTSSTRRCGRRLIAVCQCPLNQIFHFPAAVYRGKPTLGEPTSVLDLRHQQYLLLKSQSAAFQASLACHIPSPVRLGNGAPCPGDSGVTPHFLSYPASPTGCGKVPA